MGDVVGVDCLPELDSLPEAYTLAGCVLSSCCEHFHQKVASPGRVRLFLEYVNATKHSPHAGSADAFTDQRQCSEHCPAAQQLQRGHGAPSCRGAPQATDTLPTSLMTVNQVNESTTYLVNDPQQVACQRGRAEVMLGVLEAQLASVDSAAWGQQGSADRAPDSAAKNVTEASQQDVAAIIQTATALASQTTSDYQDPNNVGAASSSRGLHAARNHTDPANTSPSP